MIRCGWSGDFACAERDAHALLARRSPAHAWRRYSVAMLAALMTLP